MNFLHHVLESLGIRHTRTFVDDIYAKAQHANDLFGVIRTLAVFGVRTKAVKVDSSVIPELQTPFIMQMEGDFALVKAIDDKSVSYILKNKKHTTSTEEFCSKVEDVAVLLSADSETAGEPKYREHFFNELYHRALWFAPALWVIWMFIFSPGVESLVLSLIAAAGLAFSILLHRQWTGEGDAVSRICSVFKSSNCAAAHDTFFFNRWFDLSEVGLSFFITVIVALSAFPSLAPSVALLALLSLPFTVWSLTYQFVKQKSWCPLCVGVQGLMWVLAIACFCFSLYAPTLWSIKDFVCICLMWAAVLAIVINAYTPSVQQRRDKYKAMQRSSRILEDEAVKNVLIGETGPAPHILTIAVSPTCRYCKELEETIDTYLVPTGKFEIIKKYVPIHIGDEELIKLKLGGEEAQKHQDWSNEHGIQVTPTVFLDSKQLNSLINIEDLNYL